MGGGILSGSRGMAPIVLVILIAWALLSVMFLTGTLLAARSIDRSVAVIKPNVDEIGEDARFIDQARTIQNTSAGIRRAAMPLTGSLETTERVARRGIDPRLKSIMGKVLRINTVAGEINTTVTGIGTTVDQILTNATGIGGSGEAIRASADSILRSARGVNASARGILASGGSILSRVNSIDRGVAAIVARGETIHNFVVPIKGDLDNVDSALGQEGRGGRFPSTIVGHANSIDCSLPIDLAGLGSLASELRLTGDLRFGGQGCR